MSQNKDRWSSLSMKERMFLMQEYVKNGITDLASMRKHYNGIPYSDLNTSNYDYFNASPDMEPKKEGQHWYSRNPHTGQILKSENHPTFDLAVKGENEAGYVIRRGIDGNLYSLPKNINYVEEPNILDGTETEQTLSGKKPTLEEFIQAKVDSTRNAAFENSKNRKTGIKIPYKASKEYLEGVLRTIIDKREIADTNFIGPSIKRKEYIKNKSGNINDYRKIYYNALQEYNDKCDYGYNCIGTVTDNYPEDSRTKTNEDFYKNFNKYGFIRIPFSEVKQGDIVQSYNHALIYSGQDKYGFPLFNYSRGGVTEFDYVKDGHYPSENYIVSRYVGTPKLIQQWTTEYENTYNKKYGGKLNKFETGGPTRETTPSEAAAINKMLDNSQYMLAVGDSPDDSTYLSTDVLEPYTSEGRILDGKTEDNQTLDNEGGWSDNSRARRERRHDRYDPTGNYILQPLYMLMGGNQAAGEENEYWKAYLGLKNAVPKMNPNAKTSWDDAIEAEKIANGELPSDFYGTTPRMDLNIQAIADTLNTGKILRNYDKYKEGKYYFPNKITIEEIYKTGKKVLDNPNTWQQVEGDVVAFKNEHDDYLNESNPLGMLADFGMMWDPKTKSIYIHDTYDFGPISQIFAGKRPKEMKIRSKINFDPKKGSKLLRDDLKYFYDYPEPLTSE